MIYRIYVELRPWGVACVGPRGNIGRINKEEYYILLHTKYEIFGPCSFGEEDV